MAMTIFLALNGLGIVFLLYVLANFWMEGHRPNNDARKFVTEFGERDWSDVAFVTHPISRSARSGTPVIPFQTRSQELGGKPSRKQDAPRAKDIPLRRISTR
jgi:hypothetical protein